MSDDDKYNDLVQRIIKLEKKIQRIESALQGESSKIMEERSRSYEVEPNNDQVRITAGDETINTDAKSREEGLTESFSIGENWLNRIGIGLLLLGVIFLFKYSIDQGWLIPPVRSAIGLLIGLVLFTIGLQMKQEKGTIKQLLLGGGIAAFYITGFATFQLYDFATYAVVWIFMVIVTLLALSLSLQQDESVLSIVGILGGLGTPFMLYRGEGSLFSLIIYTTLILAGAGAIYRYKGWKSLLWSTFTAGWLLYFIVLVNSIYMKSSVTGAEQWILQSGILFFTAIIWLLPISREIGLSRNVDRYTENVEDPRSVPDNKVRKNISYTAHPAVQTISALVPLLTFFYSREIWEFNLELWGGIALIASLGVGFMYLPLRNEGLKRLSMMHGYSSLLLITVALVLLLEGNFLIISLALEALALRIITSKTADENISIASHILFAGVMAWMFNQLMEFKSPEIIFFNLDAFTLLTVIGLTGLAAPFYLRSDTVKLVYKLIAHLALLGFFFVELSNLQDGQAWVTVSWGIYSIVLIIVGFWKNDNSVKRIGMGTVFIVVGKLLLVDLSQIQAFLRILLFIGFGTLFLGLGYYLQIHMTSENTLTGEDNSQT